MKCKNCGNELLDGAVFCQACGTKQDEPAAEVKQEETKAEETKVEEAKVEEKPAEEKKEESAAQPEVQAQPQPEAQPQAAAQPQAQPKQEEGKKKSPLPIIIGCVGIVAVIALIVLVVKFIGGLGSKNSSSTAVAYVSKGTLCVITDATAKNPKILEVCDLDLDGEYISYNFISWSDDQKTLYFFDDVDDSNDVGDLCCVQISKLGKDKDKNASKVVVIDDNVYIHSFSVLSNGKLIYITSKDKLCVYSGKEPVELAKDVDDFYRVEDDKAVLYLSDYEDDGYTLSYITLGGDDEVEIDDGVDYIWSVEDDSVIYKKSEYTDDYYYIQSLFVSDFNGNTEEITDSLGMNGSSTDNGFFYTEEVSTKVTVYDYIDDPYASSDEQAVEPEYPNTDAGFVSATSDEAFDEYKLGKVIKKYNGDPVAYMEDNCWSYTYGEREYYYLYNSDTYEEYYYDIEAGVFYRYDYDVMQAARDQYYEDQEEWYAIQNRIYLREALKDYEVDPGYESLYYYHDGKSEEIVSECKDVTFVYAGLDYPMAFYHAADSSDIEKISIDDIDYSYEAYDMLFGSSAAEDYGDIYYAYGKDADIALGVSGAIGSIGGSYSEDRIAVEVRDQDKSEFILYNLNGNTLEQDSKFDDEAEVISGFQDGKVFFIKNVSDYGEKGDLFVYDGKDNTKIIKNIGLYDSGCVFSTGSMIFYDDNSKAILYNAAGEEIVKLGGIENLWYDVNYISDKKVIFFADGKLCYYNGKEVVKIATKVEYVSFVSGAGSTLRTRYSYY